ncbi:MAG: hypothetical protein JRJ43_02615 [Deltaproteobacteria bacterium]|nr:hypothetical protein [Deltaproteobacteria bacterium]MBW1718443.1 hypothetical protein [Deltaproteobacteria bacterium]MBW1931659.1 hypothetical protein [Deltaproteobacteria bacterium]MBW1939474.1 hypothetical protein [Deltaproteobacteria bacterium]MBW2080611.1 hypothetical protein [Deltaproteobacteria bacterium]
MDEFLPAVSTLRSFLKNLFIALSFLALFVIHALELTDLGLVDVNKIAHMPFFV